MCVCVCVVSGDAWQTKDLFLLSIACAPCLIVSRAFDATATNEETHGIAYVWCRRLALQ